MNKELRVYKDVLELRKSEDGKNTLTGYAAVFNSDSADMGFIERIKPGAFARCLVQNPDVRMLWNHDTNEPIGRAGVNLTLREDAKGLAFSVDLPNTTRANDVAELVRSRIVTGMSVGFIVTDDSWTEENGKSIRYINDCELFEISSVTFPAYPDTTVAKRKLEGLQAEADKHKKELRNRMDMLRIQTEVMMIFK